MKLLHGLLLICMLLWPTYTSETVIKGKQMTITSIDHVLVTGYSSRVQETDDTPFITATRDSVRCGVTTLSRDLLKKRGYRSTVYVQGYREPFIVLDTMHPRKTHQVDIWHAKTSDAILVGGKTRAVVWYEEKIVYENF